MLYETGEEEEEGYSDEYTLEDLEVGAGDYVKQEAVPDFRSAWEEMDEETELADSYGLGQRDSMQEAVEAVIAILGMQVMTVSGPVTASCLPATISPPTNILSFNSYVLHAILQSISHAACKCSQQLVCAMTAPQ